LVCRARGMEKGRGGCGSRHGVGATRSEGRVRVLPYWGYAVQPSPVGSEGSHSWRWAVHLLALGCHTGGVGGGHGTRACVGVWGIAPIGWVCGWRWAVCPCRTCGIGGGKVGKGGMRWVWGMAPVRSEGARGQRWAARPWDSDGGGHGGRSGTGSLTPLEGQRRFPRSPGAQLPKLVAFAPWPVDHVSTVVRLSIR